MKILFINSAFREGSRTKELAEYYLEKRTQETGEDKITLVDIGTAAIRPLEEDSLKSYNEAVKSGDFSDPMFDIPKQFISADEIVIAAPFWNMGIPAALHSYLELVCSQGITFDLDREGNYFSLCKAKRLVYITTAGGPIPWEDHGFGFIKQLNDAFWHIGEVLYYKADAVDIVGNDPAAILDEVKKKM